MQDALGVDAFSCSSEALVAEALLDAYKSGDEAAIRQVIASKPIFQDLDNQASINNNNRNTNNACHSGLGACGASLSSPSKYLASTVVKYLG